MSWSAPEDWSRWDPEKLLVCPYDEVHMIKAKRFQQHLLKCRQKHPEKDFVTCPFNAKHVLLRSEFRHHVSRCPDESAIECYNYKGSKKDEDGFYFKGNTSVPSYHQTEEISQQASENWDTDEDVNLPWTEQNYMIRLQHSQGMAQSTHTVTDTISLSPDEREKFKWKMRREAALRNLNSGMKLPSERCSNSQGYNRSSGNPEGGQPVSTNPVFRHCNEQSALLNSSVHEAHTADTSTNISSKPRNSIFNYCVGQMQHRSQHVTGQNNPQPGQIDACRNVMQPFGAYENISSQQSEHTANRTPTSSAQENMELEVAKVANVCEQPSLPTSSQCMTKTTPASTMQDKMELRSSFIESQMEKLALHAAVSNVCGQPTSPTSSGANGPQLAGVGRTRLLAEARKNNFGGICYGLPKAAGAEMTRAPPVGRGRGMLNYVMYSS